MTANRFFLLLALPCTLLAVYVDHIFGGDTLSPGIHEPLRHGKLMRQEMRPHEFGASVSMRSETEEGVPGPRIEAAYDMHKSFEELDEQHSRQELSVEHFQLFDATSEGMDDWSPTLEGS